MERLVRVSLTLILSWIVFAAGTLWVLGETYRRMMLFIQK